MSNTELLKEWHRKFDTWEKARIDTSEDIRTQGKALLDARAELERMKSETQLEMDRIYKALLQEFEGKRSNAEEREQRLRELQAADDYLQVATANEDSARTSAQDFQATLDELHRKDSLIKDMMRSERALINYLAAGDN